MMNRTMKALIGLLAFSGAAACVCGPRQPSPDGGQPDAGACQRGYVECNGSCMIDTLPCYVGDGGSSDGGGCPAGEEFCERFGQCISDARPCPVWDGGSSDGGGCPAGEELCDGGCADLQVDPGNCGVCGKRCPPGGMCMNGACGCECNAGMEVCSDGGASCSCVDLQVDPGNCGACGKACPSQTVCQTGQCQSVASVDGGSCGDAGPCPQGDLCCASGGTCFLNDAGRCDQSWGCVAPTDAGVCPIYS